MSLLYSKCVERAGNIKCVLNKFKSIALRNPEEEKNISKLVHLFCREYFNEYIFEDILFNEYIEPFIGDYKKITDFLDTKMIKINLRFSKQQNYSYFDSYMGKYRNFFYKKSLGKYYRPFLVFSCEKIVKSKEFAVTKHFLKDFSFCVLLYNSKSIYPIDLCCLHDLLSLALIKVRFISFLLFGNYYGSVTHKFLPRYKIRILLNMQITLLSMFLSFLYNYPLIIPFEKTEFLKKSIRLLIIDFFKK